MNISPEHDSLNLWVNPDSKVNGAHMGPTRVLSAPGGPHVAPMNLVIRDIVPTLTTMTITKL